MLNASRAYCITQVLSSTGADGVFTCSTTSGRVMLSRSADATDTLSDTQVSVTLSPVTNPVLPVETAPFTVTLYTAATATATGARRTEQGETPGVSIAHGASVLRSAVTGPSDSVAVAGQSKEWLVEGVGMAADDQVSARYMLYHCNLPVVHTPTTCCLRHHHVRRNSLALWSHVYRILLCHVL
jgi:hypothetical protein